MHFFRYSNFRTKCLALLILTHCAKTKKVAQDEEADSATLNINDATENKQSTNVVAPRDKHDPEAETLREQYGVLPYSGPPFFAMEWHEYALRLSPKLKSKFLSFEKKYKISRYEFFTVAIGEGLPWSPHFYNELAKNVEFSINSETSKDPVKHDDHKNESKSPGSLFLVEPPSDDIGRTQSGKKPQTVGDIPPGSSPYESDQPKASPLNDPKWIADKSCGGNFKPLPLNWSTIFVVYGFGVLGIDNFSSDYPALRAKSLISPDFLEEKNFICFKTKNELGATVLSALFRDLDSSLEAFAAIYAHRRRLVEEDYASYFNKNPNQSLVQASDQAQIQTQWLDDDPVFSIEDRKAYWTYRYFLAGQSASKNSLRDSKSKITKPQRSDDGLRPKSPNMKALKRVVTTRYLERRKSFDESF